ncbi:hypothetical protein SEUCBS139899_001167 [Sporothrix eucalyptigena]|uniref:Major facilitator superfamily (MFS) profile domain-containing protein n=1 Tax=Sporothrix eucalyptigena TaxID=1812306 RepID=A0ABP0B5U9_9PEZI
MSSPPKEYTGSMLRPMLVGLFVMSGALLFGIDSGELGGFMAMTPFLEDYGTYDAATKTYGIAANTQTALGGLVIAGCVVASFVAGYVGNRYGRRIGLCCTGLLGIVGVLLQVTSTRIAALYIGRIFSGASIGFASNFVTVYNGEVAPAHLRGILIGLYQTGINVGQVIGVCINQGTHALATRWAYRIPLLTQLIFPVVLCFLVWFLPESPRWLMTRDRPEKAARSLRRLRGPQYGDNRIDDEIRDLAMHIQVERQLMETSEGASAWDAMTAIFRGTDARRTHIACGCVTWQVLSGISFINSYGTYFFSVSGISNAFVISIIVQVCQLAGIIAMFPSVRWFGRRTILLWGGALQTVCMFTFAIVGTAAPGSTAAAHCLVAFTCLFGFFFTWSWGPVAWIVTSEVASNTLRSRTQGLATACTWTGTLVLQIVLPYLINADAADLGAKVGFIFGPLSLMGFVWAFFYLPETKGRSLEELDEMFANKVSVRDFATYQCVGVALQDDKTNVSVVHIEKDA